MESRAERLRLVVATRRVLVSCRGKRPATSCTPCNNIVRRIVNSLAAGPNHVAEAYDKLKEDSMYAG